MRPRRLLVILFFVAVATMAAGFATKTRTARPASLVVTCGVERWTVKTLQDRPLLRAARLTSLRFLVSRTPPGHLTQRRLPFERNAYSVVAAVTLVRSESDGDLHLVLRDGSRTMIAEAPALACTARALPRFRRAMSTARAHVRLCRRAKVTGVAFFDFNHGQTGVAANAIELHPILGFHCLS